MDMFLYNNRYVMILYYNYPIYNEKKLKLIKDYLHLLIIYKNN
jgi:hypothetical protein